MIAYHNIAGNFVENSLEGNFNFIWHGRGNSAAAAELYWPGPFSDRRACSGLHEAEL